PAWIVQDGDDPGWLLAGPATTLRSLPKAAAHELHLSWPGLPPAVSARICGDDIEQIRKAANAFASASFDDLLDDVAVAMPRTRSRRTSSIDRAAAAGLGVGEAALARAAPLLVGDEVVLRDDVVVHAVGLMFPPRLMLKGTVGEVPTTE